MPRQKRIPRPGGLYYLEQHSGNRIFSVTDDYEKFCRIVAVVRRRCKVRVLAFCLLKHAVHLVIEARDAAASEFFERVMTQYCKWLLSQGRELFPHDRHRELLVAPGFLLPLLHYMCWLPVPQEARLPRLHRPHSHPAYARRSVIGWLYTREGLRRLSRDFEKARKKYRELTSKEPPQTLVLLFQCGSLYDARIVGGYGSRSEQPRCAGRRGRKALGLSAAQATRKTGCTDGDCC